VPRAPLPDTSVTGVRVASSTTSKGITPSSSLLRAHAPNQPPPPDFVVLTFFPEVLAGCCEPPAGNRFFPTLSPQIFPQMPGPQPRRSHRVHLPVSSSASSAFLRPLSSRLPVSSANTIFRGEVSRLSSDISYVQASEFACLPDRSHRCRLSQGGRDFYFQAERASLPPHALGYAIRPIQAIGGERTFTLPDLRPCRPLQGFPVIQESREVRWRYQYVPTTAKRIVRAARNDPCSCIVHIAGVTPGADLEIFGVVIVLAKISIRLTPVFKEHQSGNRRS